MQAGISVTGVTCAQRDPFGRVSPRQNQRPRFAIIHSVRRCSSRRRCCLLKRTTDDRGRCRGRIVSNTRLSRARARIGSNKHTPSYEQAFHRTPNVRRRTSQVVLLIRSTSGEQMPGNSTKYTTGAATSPHRCAIL